MVSRRKILSRSRDDLNMEAPPEEEEDIWYNKDKLYKVGGHGVANTLISTKGGNDSAFGPCIVIQWSTKK